jgi:hypothetical protein
LRKRVDAELEQYRSIAAHTSISTINTDDEYVINGKNRHPNGELYICIPKPLVKIVLIGVDIKYTNVPTVEARK